MNAKGASTHEFLEQKEPGLSSEAMVATEEAELQLFRILGNLIHKKQQEIKQNEAQKKQAKSEYSKVITLVYRLLEVLESLKAGGAKGFIVRAKENKLYNCFETKIDKNAEDAVTAKNIFIEAMADILAAIQSSDGLKDFCNKYKAIIPDDPKQKSNSSAVILTGLGGVSPLSEFKETKKTETKEVSNILFATAPPRLGGAPKLVTTDTIIRQSDMKEWLTIPVWWNRYIDKQLPFEEVYSLMQAFKSSGLEAMADQIFLARQQNGYLESKLEDMDRKLATDLGSFLLKYRANMNSIFQLTEYVNIKKLNEILEYLNFTANLLAGNFVHLSQNLLNPENVLSLVKILADLPEKIGLAGLASNTVGFVNFLNELKTFSFEKIFNLIKEIESLESQNIYKLLDGIPRERDKFYALIRRLFQLDSSSKITISHIIDTILNLAKIRQAREFEIGSVFALVNFEVVGKGVVSTVTVPKNVCVFVYVANVRNKIDTPSQVENDKNRYLAGTSSESHNPRYEGGMSRFISCFPTNAPEGAVSENLTLQISYLGNKSFPCFITTKEIEPGDQFGADYSSKKDKSKFEFCGEKLGYFNKVGEFFATKEDLSKAIAAKAAAATAELPQLRA